MKKVLLVITMLFTFFLSPIKAETYTENPYIFLVTDVYDVINDTTLPDVNMYVYIDPQYNGLIYYDTQNGYLVNTSDSVITGVASFGNQSAVVSCEEGEHIWRAYYDTVGGTLIAEVSNTIIVIKTGNNFNWWSPSSDDTSIDLSTIQNYMLVICVLLFMNFLRGR